MYSSCSAWFLDQRQSPNTLWVALGGHQQCGQTYDLHPSVSHTSVHCIAPSCTLLHLLSSKCLFPLFHSGCIHFYRQHFSCCLPTLLWPVFLHVRHFNLPQTIQLRSFFLSILFYVTPLPFRTFTLLSHMSLNFCLLTEISFYKDPPTFSTSCHMKTKEYEFIPHMFTCSSHTSPFHIEG